ncbi:hypothetical protein H8K90_04970 [Winogradskyella echinorum]|uniref:Uncharacterized protein n=1 Tax=Winogradskyella echinorum TaxID=538189 RepID=A0ABR6XZ80_9FLAO|nr:hypothetical protein [Winogradskyella echinorum]MBC3845719.1 hypothetical protein [Winogradskyella echinorum]MBC5750067.1 hypothetical protein [Winogradskyella echinorum]
MKLTKDEIKFIDDYLIKNEVKFWDVRLELLDHIVSAVEDKITNDGTSFNEALLEIHKSFGNQFIEFGVSKTEVLTKGLYQSNIGFKKFTRNKQKEIGRKNRKRYWIILKDTLMSVSFFLEYIILILLVLASYQYKPKTALLITLVALVIPELLKFKYVFKKGVRHSLNANMVGLLNSSFLCFQGLILDFYKEEFTFNGVVDYRYIICFYLLVYPLTRASFNLYKEVLNTVKARYKLLIS